MSGLVEPRVENPSPVGVRVRTKRGTQGKRYVNAIGFLEDLCLGNIVTDVPHDGVRAIEIPTAGQSSSSRSEVVSDDDAGSTRYGSTIHASSRLIGVKTS